MNTEGISIITNNANIIMAFVTFIATIIIGYCQISLAKRMKDFETRQDKRDEDRRKDLIHAQVVTFVQKYSKGEQSPDIILLPLCVMAYKYSPAYPYRREIYREFCGLTEEVQNAVLKYCNISIHSSECANFYDLIFHILENASNLSIGRIPRYLDEKYIARALTILGNEFIPIIKCKVDEEESQDMKQLSHVFDTFAYKNSNDMYFENHIDNVIRNALKGNSINCDIDELRNEECFYAQDIGQTQLETPANAESDLLMSFLCCNTAKCIIRHFKPSDISGDYIYNYNGDRYMEDLFLETLLEIWEYDGCRL